MSEERALRLAITTADHVKAILEDQIVAGALDAIEAELRASWESSALDDRQGRETAYLMFHAVRSFRSRLEMLIKNGAVARAEIEANEAQRRREQEGKHG